MSQIQFDLISLFPKAFEAFNYMGVISRALKQDIISINLHDLREFGKGSYKQVDDLPYGGGAGMLLKPEPIYKAFESIQKKNKCLTLLMTPQGNVLKQKDFVRWASAEQLIIICGQYEGFDERIRSLADEEVSIGDYVLSGGEVPAISIINGVTRILPGTLGDPKSLLNESHNDLQIEYPQYTRPSNFRGMKVPEVLLSGNHKKIDDWRTKQSLRRTFERRNDLLIEKNKTHFNKDKDDPLYKFLQNFSQYPDW